MRLLTIILSTLLFLFIIAPVTFSHSQITCLNLGTIIDCSGPNNSSSTQVPLSRQQGVTITDQDTMPYTILPPQPSTGFSRGTLSPVAGVSIVAVDPDGSVGPRD